MNEKLLEDARLSAYLDVNDVSDLVGLQVSGQMLDTLLFVGAREHVASTATVTLRIRHFEALTEGKKVRSL